MFNRVAFACGLLVILLFASTGLVSRTVQSAPAEVDSNPAVKRVERIFEEMEAREEARDNTPRSYTLVESDLNAYLAAKIKERERRDVESLTVEMKDGLFTTNLLIDFDEIEIQGDSMTKTFFKAILRGKQTIVVDGRLKTDKGKGTYHVEQASINGVPLPPSLVNAILSAVGRRQDPPFDPSQPFDLPYAIKTITVASKKATLQT
jgi:hypothetical protein